MKKFKLRKLIFSSSSSVYGDTHSDELLKEEFDLNPISPYGRSKYFSEQIIKDAASEFDLNYVVLRYFNVIGNSEIIAHDTSRFNLLPNIYRAIENKTHLQVFGGGYQTVDGTCIRDYVDVVSLANAHCDFVKLLEKNASFPKIVNLASGVGHSVLDIIKVAKHNIDQEFKFDVIDGRSGDPSSVIADCTYAKKFVGWNPNTNLDEIVLSGWKAWTK
jgi:UDP-glucose 4-epimerase